MTGSPCLAIAVSRAPARKSRRAGAGQVRGPAMKASAAGKLRLTPVEPSRHAFRDILRADHAGEIIRLDGEALVDRHIDAARHAAETGRHRPGRFPGDPIGEP